MILSPDWMFFSITQQQNEQYYNVNNTNSLHLGLWRNLYCENDTSAQNLDIILSSNINSNCKYVNLVDIFNYIQNQRQIDDGSIDNDNSLKIAINNFRNSITILILLFFSLIIQLFAFSLILIQFIFSSRLKGKKNRILRRNLFISSTSLSITMVVSVGILFLYPTLFETTQNLFFFPSSSSPLFISLPYSSYEYDDNNNNTNYINNIDINNEINRDNQISNNNNNINNNNNNRNNNINKYSNNIENDNNNKFLIHNNKLNYKDEENYRKIVENNYGIEEVIFSFGYSYYLLFLNFFLLFFVIILLHFYYSLFFSSNFISPVTFSTIN